METLHVSDLGAAGGPSNFWHIVCDAALYQPACVDETLEAPIAHSDLTGQPAITEHDPSLCRDLSTGRWRPLSSRDRSQPPGVHGSANKRYGSAARVNLCTSSMT